ncbi:hypothetical protein [uncultured Methanobacterium sp.]|uniref:hypothetical protein n=1 Tax=uncultured Methanobacterium sp. TaxID=176306 RepID=UPI002AA894F5|nr:hypothetical protein [uncultured Methanobacterium sp.]
MAKSPYYFSGVMIENRTMNDDHLEEILKIDQNAFQRDEPHTVLNLKGPLKETA